MSRFKKHWDPEHLVTMAVPKNYFVKEDGSQVLNDPLTAAVAGGTLLGGVMGGKEQTATTKSEPWGPQQPYLTYGFDQAKNAVGTALGKGIYQGDRVAALNPYQTQGYNGVANFGNNQGVGTANNLLGLSQGALSTGSNFGSNANTLFGNAGVDPTQQIVANAGTYANNPYMDSMIGAASRDVMRNFRENELPGLDQGAAATGNMNSSRTGVMQGVLARGAQDRIGDIAATMRGNTYNNGLNLAQNQHNADFSNQLSANNQLLQGLNFGLQGARSGLDAGYGAYDAITRAGQGFQNQDQNVLNADMNKFNEEQNRPMDLIGKYMGIINGNYGGTQTQTSGGGTAGAIQGALTGGMGGLGLYTKMSQPSYGSWLSNNSGVMSSTGLSPATLIGAA